MSLASKDSKILIVGGGGTIGSSTALHLARRGYSDIRLLDKFENPSANSAGNDLNKIAGNDSAGIWGQIGQEAWHLWKTDPVFKAHAHENGRLDATSEPEREARLRARYEGIVAEGRGHLVDWVVGRQAIVERLPHLANSKVDDTWRGLWVKQAGWVAARDALNSVGLELRRLGVKTAFGTSGTFRSLLLSKEGKRCVGVRTVDGTEWEADLVVFAAGAWSPTLLDLEGQCVSKAWVYGHVQLTPEEAKHLEKIPTMYHSQLGFYMEPQPGTGLIKLVNEFEGYTHKVPCRPFGMDRDIVMSVPRSHAENPTDTFPTECEAAIAKLVDTCLPHLSGRPLINKAMCWCTDTVDSQWLLCEHPRFKGLVVATGDSGHTFKMFPVVGKQVADLIENKLPAERRHLWRWRPQVGDNLGTGRAGPQPKDLNDVEGWKHDAHLPSKL